VDLQLNGRRAPPRWPRGSPALRAEFERDCVLRMQAHSIGRLGAVDEIGRAVAFLASPLSGFITGVNLRVDSGQYRSVNGCAWRIQSRCRCR
jgi:NAD(P)-dependent dehydrogenase (short-subunit alcohol dehydrogenase family)